MNVENGRRKERKDGRRGWVGKKGRKGVESRRREGKERERWKGR